MLSRRTLAVVVLVPLLAAAGAVPPSAGAIEDGPRPSDATSAGSGSADPVRETQAASFAVSGLQAPTSATAGESITVSATVANSGDASGSTTVEYRLDGDVLATRQVSLDPGASTTVTFQVDVPDRAAGTYGHGVYLSGSDAGATGSITIATRSSPAFALFDLQAPASATVGESITVSATVRNTGDASGTTEVRYRISGQVLATQQVSLAAGESRVVAFEVTVPDLNPGTYQQQVVLETDERLSSTLVVERQAPSFTVLSLQSPSQATVGERVVAQATVANRGNAAGSTTVEYRVGSTTLASREVTLDAGATTTVVFDVTLSSISPGTYQQGVFIGGTNTGLTSTLSVVSTQPSVSVLDLQAPSRATIDDRITARATIRNGGSGSGTFRVEYRIGTRVVDSVQVSLDAGESERVTFEGQVPDLGPGTYRQGVYVAGTGAELTSTIVVEEEPGPEFSVRTLRAPSRAAVGDRIDVSAVIVNTGDESGSTQVEYRIGSRVVGRQRVRLNPGRSTTVRFNVTVPGLRADTYRQGVFIDDTDRGQTTGLRVTEGAPRFEVRNLRAPSSAQVGDRITVRATVRNTGAGDGSTFVEYRIGSQVSGAERVRLAAGRETTVSFTVTVPSVAPGTYRQGVFVEDTNRGAASDLTIRAADPPAQPDFDVFEFSGPTEVTPDNRITVRATIDNLGNAPGTTEVQYRIDGEVVATQEVTLGVDETRTVTFEATVPDLAPGNYQHGIFIADTARGRSGRLTVGAREPRFDVSNLRGSVEATAGETVSVRATVTNTGTASGRTTVQYRIDERVVATRSVNLDPGQSTTVTFEGRVPDLSSGTYRQGVFVGETDRGQTSSVVVEGDETPTTRRPIPGFGAGAALLALLVAALVLVRRRRTR